MVRAVPVVLLRVLQVARWQRLRQRQRAHGNGRCSKHAAAAHPSTTAADAAAGAAHAGNEAAGAAGGPLGGADGGQGDAAAADDAVREQLGCRGPLLGVVGQQPPYEALWRKGAAGRGRDAPSFGHAGRQGQRAAAAGGVGAYAVQGIGGGARDGDSEIELGMS